MSQVINLGQYHHLAILITFVLALLLFVMGKNEGLDFAPGHEIRFLGLSTSPTSGASHKGARSYDSLVYKEGMRSGMYPWEPPVLQNSPMSDDDKVEYNKGADAETEGMQNLAARLEGRRSGMQRNFAALETPGR